MTLFFVIFGVTQLLRAFKFFAIVFLVEHETPIHDLRPWFLVRITLNLFSGVAALSAVVAEDDLARVLALVAVGLLAGDVLVALTKRLRDRNRVTEASPPRR